MARTKPVARPQPKAKAAPPAPNPPDVEVVKPSRDDEGNEWRVSHGPDGYTVNLTTTNRRSITVTMPSEREARDHLLQYAAE